ncbi:MAG TPA: tetratricopeptide repeat protein [Polyangiaceae bacterium]
MKNEALRRRGVRAIVFASALVASAACQSKNERLVGEWQEGCSAGDLDKCASLGEAYAKGIGTPENSARAATTYRDACSRGGVRACMLLGEAYAVGSGVSKDSVQASTYLGKACDEGEEDACVRACDLLGDPVRCLRVGVLSSKGAKDLQRAASFFRKACEHGHPLGCREIATMYRDGVGVPKDANRAGELFKRADQLLRMACGGASKPEYCDM